MQYTCTKFSNRVGSRVRIESMPNAHRGKYQNMVTLTDLELSQPGTILNLYPVLVGRQQSRLVDVPRGFMQGRPGKFCTYGFKSESKHNTVHSNAAASACWTALLARAEAQA
eukprot:SAG31_NODE_11551_length_1011_cov_1.254625_1_plen_112_part_00